MKSSAGRPLKMMAMIAAASLMLSACGGDDDSGGGGGSASGADETPLDAQLDELYQAAQDAGQSSITLYGPGAAALEPLVTKFSERYPDMTVELVALVGADLITRLTSEQSSEQYAGDVAFGPENQGIFTPDYDDWFAPSEPAGAAELSPEVVNPDDLWAAPFSAAFGIGYNTEEVSEDEVPNWDDLLTPDWKGRVGLIDPSVASSTSVAFAYALGDGVIDDAWMEAMAANDPAIFPDVARLSQGLLTGEVDSGVFPLGNLLLDQRRGAPVDFNPETAVTVPHGFGVLNGAPNAEAAQLFVAWLYTPEAQESFATDLGSIPLMPGAEAPLEGIESSATLSPEEFTQQFTNVLTTWSGLLD